MSTSTRLSDYSGIIAWRAAEMLVGRLWNPALAGNTLVAAVSSWHEHHDRTCAEIERRKGSNEELVLAAHSLAETYAVLTRLPAPHRLRADDAIALIERNWRDTPIAQLTGLEMWNALHEAQRRTLIGGQMYDVLIAQSALKAEASTIITWNVRHYEAFESAIAVAAPP